MRAMALAAGIFLAASLAPSVARACASCGCGDPTLTAMGTEKPFPNRVRLSLEERFGGHTVGDPSYQEASWTLRSALSASWSPHARFTVAALVPLVSDWTQSPARPWRSYTLPGDAELSARGVIFRDRVWSPRHLVSLMAGLKMPTAPRAYDGDGYPFPDDDQPGSGSWDPFAGAGYAWFGRTLSAYGSLSYRYTTPGRRGYRHGMSLGGSAGVQLQPWSFAALAISVDVRWAAPDQLGPGVDAPNSGGTMLAMTPALVFSPLANWLIKIAYQVHVADWLIGAQGESNTILLSTVVDIN